MQDETLNLATRAAPAGRSRFKSPSLEEQVRLLDCARRLRAEALARAWRSAARRILRRPQPV